jgi:hypothetical protein
MAGLNYGNSFKKYNSLPNKEGVFYSNKSNKWVARVLNENNKYISIGQDSDEIKATAIFNNYKKGTIKF